MYFITQTSKGTYQIQSHFVTRKEVNRNPAHQYCFNHLHMNLNYDGIKKYVGYVYVVQIEFSTD